MLKNEEFWEDFETVNIHVTSLSDDEAKCEEDSGSENKDKIINHLSGSQERTEATATIRSKKISVLYYAKMKMRTTYHYSK